MNRKIIILAMGMSLLAAPAALAAEPVKLSGDVSLKYEKDTADGDPATSGTMYTLRLNAEAELGKGWALYSRLGTQYATQPALSDYNQDAAVYGADRKSVIALDQFGITFKTDHTVFKLGRQDLAVGTTALLYSRPDTNIGKKAFVDGLTVSGTVGEADLAAAVVQEDNPGSQDNKIYAFRLGFNPTQNLNWGLTLGRYQDSANGSTNHWAVDSTYKFAKSSLTGEYTKSSSDVDNKAFAATWNYAFDDKTAAYVTGFRVEANGAMGQQSDFDNDNRGTYFGVTHKLGDADSLEVVYKDQKFISTGQKNTKFEATFTHSF